MDTTDLLKVSGLSASSIAIVLIIYRIGKLVVGKKLVSSCCGKKMEVGIDVVNMTPTPDQVAIEIKNPMPKINSPPVIDVGQSVS